MTIDVLISQQSVNAALVLQTDRDRNLLQMQDEEEEQEAMNVYRTETIFLKLN